ncbi:hypothetical protein SMICM304S_00191 [Streptomyces microflavus]
MAKVGPDTGCDFPAVRTGHGAQLEIDVDACAAHAPAQSPAWRRVVAVSIIEAGTANSRTRGQKDVRESRFAVRVSISTHLARTGPPICSWSESSREA